MRRLLNNLLVAAVILAGASATGQQPGGFPQGGPGMGMRGQGPFMPGQGGPGMPPMPPTLAAKTAQVMALRRIVGLKLTRADIAAALPQVKALRAAEKALESTAEKALDEEKKALLAAGPNSAAPRGGGRTMREAADTLRAKHEETWNALAEAIGPAKARGLQQLVGGGGGGFQMQPGMPGMPGMGGPGGGMPGMPGAGGGMRPNAGQRGGGGQGMRRPGGPGGMPGGGMEGPGGPGGMPGMGGPGMGPGPMGGGQPGMGNPGGMMGAMPVRISVGELLELLEQKLAAMPR
ncbi:MAG: hypothetical protein NT029_02610 [Armatimonadetes bacterium]|nr:hypothetical protein [Armatimonadota bacterium]